MAMVSEYTEGVPTDLVPIELELPDKVDSVVNVDGLPGAGKAQRCRSAQWRELINHCKPSSLQYVRAEVLAGITTGITQVPEGVAFR